MSKLTYYKVVRPDGTDFYTGTVQWVSESGIPAEGFVVNHPTSTTWESDHATNLCASTSPTDCAGSAWPCRLLEVEPVAEAHEHAGCKVSALSWRVLRELPATQALGPQGDAVAVLIDGMRRLDAASLARLVDTWDDSREAALEDAWNFAWNSSWDSERDAAWSAAWWSARDSAWNATQEAAWDSARDDSQESVQDSVWNAVKDAAWDASIALVTWDLIDPDDRDILTAHIRTALPDLWSDVSSHLKEIDR